MSKANNIKTGRTQDSDKINAPVDIFAWGFVPHHVVAMIQHAKPDPFYELMPEDVLDAKTGQTIRTTMGEARSMILHGEAVMKGFYPEECDEV